MSLIKYDSIFDVPSIFSLLDEYETISTRKSFFPAADVSENETEYEVALSTPGLAKSDFNIKVENRSLIVSGEKKSVEKKYNFKESVQGKFVRRFTLPAEVNTDTISASYENGILTIKVPKDAEKSKTRLIEVK